MIALVGGFIEQSLKVIGNGGVLLWGVKMKNV